MQSEAMTTTKIEAAKRFAHAAHDSIAQKRKYTGAPYWSHTDAVAALVAAHGGSNDMVAAAHLHDVLEDVAVDNVLDHKFGFNAIRAEFGDRVAWMVFHLTDLFTSRNLPHANRARRKELEANRFAFVPNEVKTIKLADLVHNTTDIMKHDAKFGAVYLREKAVLLTSLVGGDADLFALASKKS